jgi:hypothetical protein
VTGGWRDRRRQQDRPGAGVDGDLTDAPVGSFQSATTLEGATPGGRERSTMPNDVSVRTAEPARARTEPLLIARARIQLTGASSSGTAAESDWPSRPFFTAPPTQTAASSILPRGDPVDAPANAGLIP